MIKNTIKRNESSHTKSDPRIRHHQWCGQIGNRQWLAKKICNLRVFDDENGVMNKSVLDVGGDILVVSQFTLWASYKKGNRPSYLRAGSHEVTVPLYERFLEVVEEQLGKPVAAGEFGAEMKVELLNDGPVTICMDTKNKE